MQSGIQASQELLDAFGDLKSSPHTRGLIINIAKESLVPVTTIQSQGTFEDDLSQLDSIIKDNEAAYIILRNNNCGLITITYVPDIANVRSKMLFASTRNTLLRALGTENFEENLFMTNKAEVSVAGFQKHHAHESKPAPLTEEERALIGVKEAEEKESRGTTARSSHVSSGVSFPVSEEALSALKNLDSSTSGLVQLAIDLQKETIELADSSETSIHDIGAAIPDTSPRYSFFVFNHTYEGKAESPIVFLYTCPTQSKIKERMLYASCRSNVVSIAEKEAGIKVAKKLESATADVTEAQLMEEFHPKKEEKAAFQRPKRPGRK